MAALFLLALALIVWQALRTEPASQPGFEIATKAGERLSPVAVPSWHSPLQPPTELRERFTFLAERALAWPTPEDAAEAGVQDCRVFLRLSSQHWVLRRASSPRVRQWCEHRDPGAVGPWRRVYLPVQSFLDDDDGDGDPLDDRELRQVEPGAEVEIFCDEVRPTFGDPP